MLNELTGTLILHPRLTQPEAGANDGETTFTVDANVVQLAPAVEPGASWEDDLMTLLARAVKHTLSVGGQLRVERGGWDSPPSPFCSVEVAWSEDREQYLYFETSPIPVGTRWWEDRMHQVNETTTRLVLRLADFKPDQAAFLIWDAICRGDVSPWDLVLTFASPPRTPEPV